MRCRAVCAGPGLKGAASVRRRNVVACPGRLDSDSEREIASGLGGFPSFAKSGLRVSECSGDSTATHQNDVSGATRTTIVLRRRRRLRRSDMGFHHFRRGLESCLEGPEPSLFAAGLFRRDHIHPRHPPLPTPREARWSRSLAILGGPDKLGKLVLGIRYAHLILCMMAI